MVKRYAALLHPCSSSAMMYVASTRNAAGHRRGVRRLVHDHVRHREHSLHSTRTGTDLTPIPAHAALGGQGSKYPPY
jgi:hypothetical protein